LESRPDSLAKWTILTIKWFATANLLNACLRIDTSADRSAFTLGSGLLRCRKSKIPTFIVGDHFVLRVTYDTSY
jgi:hypothetical protein